MQEAEELYPGIIIEQPPAEETKETYEVFYLWEENSKLFKIFKILRNYLSEYYAIDSAVLLELIKDSKLNVTKSLSLMPYIHYGYLSIIVEEKPKNGSEDTGD